MNVISVEYVRIKKKKVYYKLFTKRYSINAYQMFVKKRKDKFKRFVDQI
jgi:hypothetical protein